MGNRKFINTQQASGTQAKIFSEIYGEVRVNKKCAYFFANFETLWKVYLPIH